MSQMAYNNKNNKLLPFNYFNPIPTLPTNLTSQDIQRFHQNQFQIHNNHPPYIPSHIYPYIAMNNSFSYNPFHLQAMQFPSPNIIPVVPASRQSCRTDQSSKSKYQQQQSEHKGTGIKLKKTSKKPERQQQSIQQQHDTDQESGNIKKQSEINSQCGSLSEQSKPKAQTKDSSVSAPEDAKYNQDEGLVKFFPKEADHYYTTDDQEELIHEYTLTIKSIMKKGFGYKSFYLYLKENNVDYLVNTDLLYENQPRYYRLAYCVMKKLIHSVEYFLEKECFLQIRRMKLIQFKNIKRDLVNYKLNFEKKYIKTIQKLLKIIVNIEDITLTERQIIDLHTYLLKKVDQQYNPRTELHARDTYISDFEPGPPYTMRRDKKYSKVYKNAQNVFQIRWKNEIQRFFIAHYTQNTNLAYCSERLRLAYPQYKKLLTVNNLKIHLQRIFRGAFGKFKNFIQKLKNQKSTSLPVLSPIDNDVFKKIISMKHYQKARFVLTRLHNEELTEQNCALFIQKMNESIRQFQAFQGLMIIRNQYLTAQFEPNVVSLRPRLKKKYEVLRGLQYSQEYQEQQEQQNKEIQENQENVSKELNKKSKKPIVIQDSIVKEKEYSFPGNFSDVFYDED